MKVSINKDVCIGCGLCANDCPDIFEMSGDKATTKLTNVPKAQEEACKNAATNCPVQAIVCE
ncbi:MAG: ferredoxin [Elusimicrobiales bacterium]